MGEGEMYNFVKIYSSAFYKENPEQHRTANMRVTCIHREIMVKVCVTFINPEIDPPQRSFRLLIVKPFSHDPTGGHVHLKPEQIGRCTSDILPRPPPPRDE